MADGAAESGAARTERLGKMEGAPSADPRLEPGELELWREKYSGSSTLAREILQTFERDMIGQGVPENMAEELINDFEQNLKEQLGVDPEKLAEDPEMMMRLMQGGEEMIGIVLQQMAQTPPAAAAKKRVFTDEGMNVEEPYDASTEVDLLIIGAGACGVGCGVIAKLFGIDPSKTLIVERGSAVGSTFEKWPAEMHFITPSFNQQAFGMMDLNSVAFDTSPAQMFHTQHPSGQQYARYLRVVAHTHNLPVVLHTDVTAVTPIGKREPTKTEEQVIDEIFSHSDKDGDGFLNMEEFNELQESCGNDVPTEEQWEMMLDALSAAADCCPQTAGLTRQALSVLYQEASEGPREDHQKLGLSRNDDGFEVTVAQSPKATRRLPPTIRAKFIIWAAGEFQYPRTDGFPGASENCVHNSSITSWAELAQNNDEMVVIGGYESGMDATVHLAKAGCDVTVLASTPFWSMRTLDPSTELAPFTAGRLQSVMQGAHPPTLMSHRRVTSVEKDEHGAYVVTAARTKTLVDTETISLQVRRPASGFGVSLQSSKIIMVESVEAGGPAEQAGLRAGDVVAELAGVEVDGTSHGLWEAMELVNRLSAQGQEAFEWKVLRMPQHDADGKEGQTNSVRIKTKAKPILATGFKSGVGKLVNHLFAWTEDSLCASDNGNPAAEQDKADHGAAADLSESVEPAESDTNRNSVPHGHGASHGHGHGHGHGHSAQPTDDGDHSNHGHAHDDADGVCDCQHDGHAEHGQHEDHDHGHGHGHGHGHAEVLTMSTMFNGASDMLPAGDAKLTKCDESTICPGLFLCGPQVRQDGQIFCFVYKYRQRFAVAVNEISRRLGLPEAEIKKAVDTCRKHHMFLDDLSCCEATCGADGAC